MSEGAGRIHKVFAQRGEIRSEAMQYPVTFDVTTTKMNDGQALPCMDLTEIFPNHAQVAFIAIRTASGQYEARDVTLLEQPSVDEAPKIDVDYGIVTRVDQFGGDINWLKYGYLRFVKESLVLKGPQDVQLPLTDLVQVGRTVRFKADISGMRGRWKAISVTPVSDVVLCRGQVSRVLEGHGWITSTEHGEIYFPYGRFVQPNDPDKRIALPEHLLHAEVDVQMCASLPGARGRWRAFSVRLPE